jgi:ribosomal protein S18 acetylase RimI-like enzyme
MAVGFVNKEVKSHRIVGKIIIVQRRGKEIKIRPVSLSIAQSLPSITPLLYLAYRASCKCLSLLQKLKPYRSYMRKLFQTRIIYKVADEKEAAVSSILHCFGQSFLPMQKQAQVQQNIYHIIAKTKDEIVGRLSLVYRKEGVFIGWGIYGAYVKPLYRGLGIGEGLMAETFRVLEKEKIKEVYLCVNRKNLRAIELYKKIGFQKIEMPEQEAKPKAGSSIMIVMKRDLR